MKKVQTEEQVQKRFLPMLSEDGWSYDMVYDYNYFCIHVEFDGIRLFTVDDIETPRKVISAMVDAYFKAQN